MESITHYLQGIGPLKLYKNSLKKALLDSFPEFRGICGTSPSCLAFIELMNYCVGAKVFPRGTNKASPLQ